MAARAALSAGPDRDVAELAGDAEGTAHRPAGDMDDSGDAGADDRHQVIVHADGRSHSPLGQSGGIHVVLEHRGETGGLGDDVTQWQIAEPDVGGPHGTARARVDHPGHDDPHRPRVRRGGARQLGDDGHQLGHDRLGTVGHRRRTRQLVQELPVGADDGALDRRAADVDGDHRTASRSLARIAT